MSQDSLSLDDAELVNADVSVTVDRSTKPLYEPDDDVDFELVEQEPTDFELGETTTPVELVRSPGAELVPYEVETGFEIVEDDSRVTAFELVEEREPPSIVPAQDPDLVVRNDDTGQPP